MSAIMNRGRVFGRNCPGCGKIMAKNPRRKGGWICRNCGGTEAPPTNAKGTQAWFTGRTQQRRYR